MHDTEFEWLEYLLLQREVHYIHTDDTYEGTNSSTGEDEVQPTFDNPDLNCFACTTSKTTNIASSCHHAMSTFCSYSRYSGLEVDIFFWGVPDEISGEQEKWEPKAIIGTSLC